MTTVGEVFSTYQPLIESRIAQGTARAYRYAWRQRVGPIFGDREIESVRTIDVELAFASWAGSYSIRVDALATLSAICRVAVKAGLIAANPCIGVERPTIQASDPTSRALTFDEVRTLLDVLPQSGHYRRFVLAMLYTGCRVGEIAALRVSDIRWETGAIKIERTASPGLTGQMVVGPTKGRRGRLVPLAEPLVPILAEASAGKGPHDLVFTGPRGGFVTSKNLSRALRWPQIRGRVKTFPAGEPPLHWHDLRHTNAVLLFLGQVAAPDVQSILGHSSLAVTQLYANTRNEAARRGATALSALFARQSIGQNRGGEVAAETASDLDI